MSVADCIYESLKETGKALAIAGVAAASLGLAYYFGPVGAAAAGSLGKFID